MKRKNKELQGIKIGDYVAIECYSNGKLFSRSTTPFRVADISVINDSRAHVILSSNPGDYDHKIVDGWNKYEFTTPNGDRVFHKLVPFNS